MRGAQFFLRGGAERSKCRKCGRGCDEIVVFVLSLPKMNRQNKYRVEIECDYAEWSRYRVEMLCAALDAEGERVGFTSASDREESKASTDPLTLETAPCHHARLFLYVIPHTLPVETRIEATPPFEVKVRIFCNDRPLRTDRYAVNQWGGLSVEVLLQEA